MPRLRETPPETAFAIDRWRARLHLTPDQDEKLRPIMQQADNELRNLRTLDLREIKGILDRAEERVNPVLTRDQRQRLRQMLEDRKQRLDEWFNVPEPADQAGRVRTRRAGRPLRRREDREAEQS